jgi:hypothetical protein
MKRRTLATWAGAAVLTTALVAGGAIAASASPVATSGTTSASQCSAGHHLVSLLRALPANLQSDLKALRAMPKGSERTAAAKAIRQKALDGTYGADVQARAEKVQGRAFASFGKLPDNLKSDLKAAKAASPADRAALVKAIGQNALAGDYGDAIKSAAQNIQTSTFWQDCVVN